MNTRDAPSEEPAVDYRALREGIGARWAARDFVSVNGPEAVSWLQGQLSQDVSALDVGESADSLLLSPQGKLDAFLRVTRLGDEEMLLDVEGGYGDAVQARLERFKLRTKAVLARRLWRCLSLRGPGVLRFASDSGADGQLALPASWPGLVGVDIVGEWPTVPAGVRWCGPQSWEAVRIEAGTPRMGAELGQRTIPVEAGLNERAVSFEKGCYTGQELVARLEARGNRVPRRLRGVLFRVVLNAEGPLGGEGPFSPGGAMAQAGLPPPGTSLVEPGEDKPIGELTSVAVSPGFSAPVGLAYIRREATVPCDAVVRCAGADVPVRVLELPLVA